MSQVKSKSNNGRKRIVGIASICFALAFFIVACLSPCSISQAQAAPENRVYLGGIPVGLKLSSDGLTIAGFVPVITESGTFNPAEESGLKIGDMLIEGNGKALKSPSDVTALVKSATAGIKFVYSRSGVRGEVSITPVFDPLAGEKKIGVVVKNEIAGVGTLTFTAQDGRFCTLGHQISDPNVNDEVNYQSGFVYSCKILGAVKGVKGEAGALKGVFDRDSEPIGNVDANGIYGVYGTAVGSALKSGALIDVATVSDVKPGKAHVYSTIEGTSPKRYDVEIVKTISQKRRDTRGLLIRVTDKALIKATGGIVQGMSGSPIVQNGKLVGAITHVLIDDPTYGYGIYAEWLIAR